MKGFLIGLGSLMAFVGIFYVIINGQNYEHAAAGAHFDTFYETPLVYADNAHHDIFACKQGPNFIFDDKERQVTVFFDTESYAILEFDQAVSIPEGVQYRNSEDNLTVNNDDTAFLIIDGKRVASDCLVKKANL